MQDHFNTLINKVVHLIECLDLIYAFLHFYLQNPQGMVWLNKMEWKKCKIFKLKSKNFLSIYLSFLVTKLTLNDAKTNIYFWFNLIYFYTMPIKFKPKAFYSWIGKDYNRIILLCPTMESPNHLKHLINTISVKNVKYNILKIILYYLFYSK